MSRYARVLGVTDAEYFADPCDAPSLSQSIAQVLLNESPRHAWLRHPKLGNQPKDPTKALDEGSILHKLVLGKGADVFVVQEDNYKTKSAQSIRDAAIAEGKIPILAKQYVELVKAAEQLRSKCAEFGFPFTGQSEIAIEWRDGEERNVICRGRMDHVFLDRGVIYDVKKTRNAHPNYLKRKFVELGYDIQYAAYTRAVAALHPELEGRIDFVFLFMETEAPYSVVPARPDGALREIGHSRWSRAVDLWGKCLRENHWPSYCESAVTLDAPSWVITQELGTDGEL